MASASSWDAARHRVDRRRRTAFRAAAMAAKPQPRGVSGARQRAAAAAVQPVFPETLPEPVDPADRVRTDRAKRGARRDLQARSRDHHSAGRSARRQGRAGPCNIIRRALSADLAEARTRQGKPAAAEAAGAAALDAGRSRLRRARRPHDAGSAGHPERDARRLPAARSRRNRDRRPRGKRASRCRTWKRSPKRCRDASAARFACASQSTTSPRSIP